MIRPIRTEKDYTEALKRIDELFNAKAGSTEADELDVLTALVEQYEDSNFPIEAPDPVSAIKFRMEQQGLKTADLIPFIGSKSKVSEVLSGKRGLSIAMIRRLHEGLNIPLKSLFADKKASLAKPEIGEHAETFPFTEMYRSGWFSDYFSGSLSEAKIYKEEILSDFIGSYGTSSTAPALNRQSQIRCPKEEADELLLAWRIRIMNLASREILAGWDSRSLSRDSMRSIAQLSFFDEGPLLAKQFLNKIGIHLIIQEHLQKTHLDGSALLMPDGSPLIGLTLRYDRLDSFWFTLFHELAHVFLHLSKQRSTVFFDDMTESSPERYESEADSFSQEILIPRASLENSGLSAGSSPAEIKALARQLRISPAIPAGRIRHDSGNYRLFTALVGNGKVRSLFEPRGIKTGN